MENALASGAPAAGSSAWTGIWFRAARVFLLILIIVLPMEAVTAARETAMMGAAVMLAVHLFVSGDRRFRTTVLFWPLALYAAAAAFSLVNAVDFPYSLRELRAEVLKGLIIFYTGVHFVRVEEHLRQAWGALLAGAAIMGLAGVILFIYFGGTPLHLYVRAGSLHSGYGAFGTYLVTIWPFVLLAPLALEKGRLRTACLALIPLIAICGYITFSRASWLGMLVECGLCLLALSRRRLRAAAAGLFALVLLAGALLLVPGSNHGERWGRLMTNPEQVGGTAGDLLALWKYSGRYLAHHPFTGIGLGRHSFSKKFRQFRRTHQPLLWHSHNMFVEAALQMGLQGLAAVILIFLVLTVTLWPHAPPRAGDAPGLFATAAAVMVAGFSIRNLTDDFFVDDSALMFWLLAGLALGAGFLKSARGGGKALTSTLPGKT